METIVSGDSTPIDIVLTDDVTGAAVDLSTVTDIIYEIASSSAADTSYVSKSLTDGITVTGNIVTVALDPADTESLAGVYYHELQVTGADGAVETPIRAYVSIERDLI